MYIVRTCISYSTVKCGVWPQGVELRQKYSISHVGPPGQTQFLEWSPNINLCLSGRIQST